MRGSAETAVVAPAKSDATQGGRRARHVDAFAGRRRRTPEALGAALALAYGVGFWLVLLQATEGVRESGEPTLLVHWLRDSTLALPGILVATMLAWRAVGVIPPREVDGRRGRAVLAAAVALGASAATAAGSPVHGLMFGVDDADALTLLTHAVRDGLLALVVALPLAGGALARRDPRAGRATRRLAFEVGGAAVLAVGGAGAVLAAVAYDGPATAAAAPRASAPTSFGLVSLQGARVLGAAPAEPPPHGANESGHGKVRLEVALALTNRLDRPVLQSPGQFRLRVGPDGPTITALRSSIRSGRLRAGRTLDLRLVFIAPRGPRLSVEFQDLERLQPLRIQLPRLSTQAGPVPSGVYHPSHRKEKRP